MSYPVSIGNITVSVLEGSDIIAVSREDINANFKSLAEAVNEYREFLDPIQKSLGNIESLSVKKGTSSITDILITTNGSITAGGSITAKLSISANTASIKSGITLSSGKFSMPDPNSVMDCNGTIALGGELILKDFGNQYVKASDKQTFTSNNWANLVTDQYNNVIGGSISLAGTNSIIFDFSEYVSDIDSRYFINKIKLNTEHITIGTRVLIVVLLGNNNSKEFIIMNSTLKSYRDMSIGMIFNKSYQVAEVIFDGTNWVVLNCSQDVVLH
jgi:hypothetical protein